MTSLITLFLVSCTKLPVARFGLDRNTVETGQPIQFNDQSIGEIVTWSWDFGDNTTSSEQTPVHAYSKPGNYTVILTVSNKAGSNSMSSMVSVIEPLVAEFSASKTRVLWSEPLRLDTTG